MDRLKWVEKKNSFTFPKILHYTIGKNNFVLFKNKIWPKDSSTVLVMFTSSTDINKVISVACVWKKETNLQNIYLQHRIKTDHSLYVIFLPSHMDCIFMYCFLYTRIPSVLGVSGFCL